MINKIVEAITNILLVVVVVICLWGIYASITIINAVEHHQLAHVWPLG